MGKITKLWNVTFFKWLKNEAPRLEFTLFHYVEGDAFYFIYIQLYKLVFSVSFDIYERMLRRTGYYNQRG